MTGSFIEPTQDSALFQAMCRAAPPRYLFQLAAPGAFFMPKQPGFASAFLRLASALLPHGDIDSSLDDIIAGLPPPAAVCRPLSFYMLVISYGDGYRMISSKTPAARQFTSAFTTRFTPARRHVDNASHTTPP